MRLLHALVFLVLLLAILVFAVQNTDTVPVRFLKWSISPPFAILAVSIYVLGMLSGWTVVSFVARSIRKVRERPKSSER